MNTPRRLLHPILLTLCAALLFGGCASTQNPQSRNDIASLKTAHLAFIDEFTEGPGKTWDDQRLAARKAALESQFAATEQEAAKTKDANRNKAVANLHSRFKKHVATLERQKAFFRPTYAADLKTALSKNYDMALKGEDIR